MPLNKSTGNMYEFITHTWNAIKGRCHHDCSYCYMKRWGDLKPVRLDVKEFKTDLGQGNFIFVGSSCDMFANDIPSEWISKVFNYCDLFENKYLFQTKNPANIRRIMPMNSSVCVTLESNRFYPEIMRNSPSPSDRVKEMQLIRHPLFITIEPIIDFDFYNFIEMIKACDPLQVNIGADSGRHGLPEPSKEKIDELVNELSRFTKVVHKKNLRRIV